MSAPNAGNTSLLNVEQVKELAARGWSKLRVAQALGVSETSIRRISRRHGIEFRYATPGPMPVAETPDEITREELLEAELTELRRQTSKTRKADVHAERITRSVEEALRNVPPPSRAAAASAPKEPKGAHHRQMVLLSDFHGGEVVDPEIVDGYEYDWRVMERRVDEVIASLLSHKKRSPDLTGLDIVFGGDMCSGSNHDELAVTNQYPLAEQAVRMGALQGQIIERLVPHYPDIKVVSVEGNHPRLSKKPAAKNPHDNGDWIASMFARQYMSGYPTVSYTVGRAHVTHTIAGRRCYIWHGDGVRSSMPGIPEGGIARRVNTLQSTLPYRVDHWIHFHFHTAYVKQGGRIIGNGALKGPDEWVKKAFGGGDPPAQLLLTFDEKAERMTDVRLITPTAGVPS